MAELNSEYSLQSVFHAVQDAIFVIDMHGIINNCNNTALDFFGYTRDEIINQPINILMPKSVATIHHTYLNATEDVLENKIIGKSREIKAVHKNGTEFPIEISISKFIVKDEVYYTGTIRDISERYKLVKLRENFLAIVSHELRTPLAAVKGVFQLLRLQNRNMTQDDIQEMLQLGEENVFCLEKLVNDLLDIQKIETNTMKYELKPLLVTVLLEKLDNRCKNTIKDRQILVNYDGDSDIFILADEFRLLQVLINLTNNAIKYDKSTNPIQVNAFVNNNALRVNVIDDGPGIDNEFAPRLFQQFSQAEDAMTRNHNGVGLGLFICKKIIDAHNGIISYESNPGGGSIFYFEIPLYDN